jgi:hypothetical protein
MLATLNPRQPYLPFFFDLNSPGIPRDRTPIRFSAGSNRAKIAAFWSPPFRHFPAAGSYFA